MKCPACSKSLHEIAAGDIQLEICGDGCGGLWFDWQELKKFDEPHEFLPEKIFDLQQRYSAPQSHDLRYCPKCGENEVLCRRWYDIKNEVEVDQCLKCSGIWLDTGEIVAIRRQYATEAERLKAADAYLGQHLQETKEALAAGTQERLNIDQERYDRYRQEGIEPSRLTKLFRELIGK